MNTLPPPPGAIADAQTLLRVIADPASAQKLLDALAESTAQHTQALTNVVERIKAAEAKEAEVAALSSALDARAANVVSAEAALAAKVSAHEKEAADLLSQKNTLATERALHAKNVDTSRAELSQAQSAVQSQKTQLDQRRRKQDEEHAARMTAVSARETAVSEREAAVTKAAEEVERKRAELRAYLS